MEPKGPQTRMSDAEGSARPGTIGVATTLAASLVLLASPALAADGHGAGGDYGVHVGYSKARQAEDGDFLIGGHLEARLAPALGIEAAVDYHGTEEYPAASVTDPPLEVRTIPVTLSARVYLPVVARFSPFLAAGGGWYNVIYDYPNRFEALGFDDETVSTFGWHLGLGGKIWLDESVSIYGEGRYSFIDPDKELGDEVRDEIGELDYDRSTLRAGLSLEF